MPPTDIGTVDGGNFASVGSLTPLTVPLSIKPLLAGYAATFAMQGRKGVIPPARAVGPAKVGGGAVPDLQQPFEPMRVPEFQGAEVRIGRRRYVGWDRAGSAGEDVLTRYMTYRTHHEDELVGETEVSYGWWTLTEHRLCEELAEQDFLAKRTAPGEFGMYVITRG
ncbi:hypothetical protein AB0M44_49390 [Streptosporangium subroseum]|uniref:hypothetical protein n=1 Tax=Streptosporangium subroseum TaxID=106412 RepID=UPI0034206243